MTDYEVNKNLNKSGFTLIELIIAVGLAAIFLPAIAYSLSFSLSTARQGENYSMSYSKGQEMMEAVYYIKNKMGTDWNCSTTPADTSAGEYYQPYKNAGVWTMGPKVLSSALTKDGNFTKTVQIESVKRVGGQISEDPWAVAEAGDCTKKVTVKVAWKENGGEKDTQLVSYVTQH